jgi:hypothetical protein
MKQLPRATQALAPCASTPATLRALPLIACLELLACRRDPDVEPPRLVMHGGGVRAAPVLEDAGAPDPFPVQLEVTTAIVESTVDKAAGTTLVTAGAGVNHGVKLDWIGSVIDDAGKDAGRFTILEVKQRTTLGATTLTAKQLEGKRVWLRSPPPP